MFGRVAVQYTLTKTNKMETNEGNSSLLKNKIVFCDSALRLCWGCAVPQEIYFPRYNMKCSEENVILRGIVHVVSCFHCISWYIAEIWITFRTVCGEGRQVWLYPTWYSKWLDSISAWGPCRSTLPVPIRALFSLLFVSSGSIPHSARTDSSLPVPVLI